MEDWRQLHRKPGEPPIELGDLIPGMSKRKDGRWVGIVAPVEEVVLLRTEADGSRIYGVRLGESVEGPE